VGFNERLGLLQNHHLACLTVIPGLQAVEVDPAGHRLTIGITSIPVNGSGRGGVVACFLPAQFQFSDQTPLTIIDRQTNLCFFTQLVRYPGFWIEWIGIVSPQLGLIWTVSGSDAAITSLLVTDGFQLLQTFISNDLLVNCVVTQQLQAHRLSTLALVTLVCL